MDVLAIIKKLKAQYPVLQGDENMDQLEAAVSEQGAEEESITPPSEINVMEGPSPEEMGEEDMGPALDLDISSMEDGEEGLEKEAPEDMEEELPIRASKMKRKGGPSMKNLKKKPVPRNESALPPGSIHGGS